MASRIQRKRTKGWKMGDAVYVGRPSRWGNPFAVNHGLTRAEAVQRFHDYARWRLRISPDWLAPLRGKDLCCWCAEGEACHADILLALANN